MRIIVIGAGKVGKEICRQLGGGSYDIIAVDIRESAISELTGSADIKGVVGAGELVAVQREADVPRADLVVAVTEKDETNILCCLIAKSLKCRHTVARVRDLEMAAQAEFMRENLGIDVIVNPEYEAAVAISRLLRYPAAAQVDYSDKARVDIVSVEIGSGNALVGQSLMAAAKAMKLKVLICAVGRGNAVIIPNGNFIFQAEDTVFVTGKYLSIESFFKRCRLPSQHIKNAVLIGGGRISRYLAESLNENGIAIKIFEKDKKIAEAISEELEFATVVCGDGTNKGLLAEEGVDGADALISLTDHDEMNIMISLYAKNLGVGKVITKINNPAFAEIAEPLGLGGAVSPKSAAGGQILRFVQSIARHDESMLASYPLFGGAAYATAFTVDDERLTDVPLKNLKLKKNLLIASMIKGGAVHIPDGGTELQAGDTVLVISTDDKLKKIEEILD